MFEFEFLLEPLEVSSCGARCDLEHFGDFLKCGSTAASEHQRAETFQACNLDELSGGTSTGKTGW